MLLDSCLIAWQAGKFTLLLLAAVQPLMFLGVEHPACERWRATAATLCCILASHPASAEAANVEKVVTHLLRGGVTPAQIGVITPYEGQRAHVLSTLTRSGPLNATLYTEARACCCF